MKSIFFFPVFILVQFTYAQQQEPFLNFDSLLNRGKAELRKEITQQNYSDAIFDLKKAEVLNPDNPEVHYFLGCGYSRTNAKDAQQIIHMKLPLVIKASEEFEYLTQLTPHYIGEKLILDSYSKITSEWGALALAYWNNYKTDSMLYAFNEGRRRGGFSDFYLSLNRYILDHCKRSSFLISSGDNMTFSLLYLQAVENYRRDVLVIDISLLNTTWYPKALARKNDIDFGTPMQSLDTIHDSPWKGSQVSIKDKYTRNSFSWFVKPCADGGYLQRSDQLLLGLLKANECGRDVFFTLGFDVKDQLGLENQLFPMIALEQIDVQKTKMYDAVLYEKELTSLLKLAQFANINSDDELQTIDLLRTDALIHIQQEYQSGNKKCVKKWFQLLDEYVPENKFPYSSKEIERYAEHLRK